MKHPTPEELKPLLNAVDTAVWAWAVKGGRVKVDWKSALKELREAWEAFQIKTDDSILVTSGDVP